METCQDQPLSDEELITLDNFLLQSADDESLAIDEAHGFLTGLIIGRSPLQESRWLEMIWGQPAFSSATEQRQMTDLLQRLHGEIQAELASGRKFEPLVTEMEEAGETFLDYEGWCFGFMMALALEQEKWDTLPDQQQALLTPIGELALAYVEENSVIDDDEYEMLIELIPGSVVALYRYWEKQERARLH